MNQKILVKEEKLKRNRDKVEQCKQNKTFQNNKKKKIGGECTSTNQQLDAKETKKFWSKIWEQKELKRKG